MRTVLLALVLLGPATAQAWDSDMLWNNPAQGGNGPPGALNALMPGGGGIYGTGGARDYTITCASCHVNDKSQQGQIDALLSFSPTLGAGNAYKPGQLYTVTIALQGEHLGQSGCSPYVDGNINQFAASIEDASGKPTGVLASDSGQSATSCPTDAPSSVSGSTLLYGDCHAVTSHSGKAMANTTSWTFQWTAPAAGSGPITVFWGIVDGDCMMDSLGDDVKTGNMKLTEATAATARSRPPFALALLLLLPPAWWHRRRPKPGMRSDLLMSALGRLLPALLLLVACNSSPDQGGPDLAGTDLAGSDLAGSDATSLPAPAPGCPTIASDPVIRQALPIATVSTELPMQAGQTRSVQAGESLQAAIDAAQPGDTIELAAGATFMGPITLPEKSGDGWIVVRTSTPDADFAMPGTRVSPALAPKMAKISVPAMDSSIIRVAPRAHHFRLIGLEVTPAPGAYVYAAVDLTVETANDADLAHDIILDRVYLHADAIGARRGVALNSKSSAVIDSYVSQFRERGADSQAIAGWNGPGPYRIVNNYLEGASENVIFGGADPSVPNLVPSDIQICGNHIKKDLAWKGDGWNVKNLLELKNARRVLIAGNVMEYNWGDAQVGFAVLFTPRNQSGTAPWSGDADITLAYNIIRHSASALNMAASDDVYPSIPLQRVVVRDNLFDDIDALAYNGDGRQFQFIYGGGGGADIKVDHNTSTSGVNSALSLGDTAKYGTNFVFTNNVVAHANYGVIGSGQSEGNASLDFYLSGYTFSNNALFGGGSASSYPAGNFFPTARADVGFASPSTGDWSLSPASPFKSAGTDGKDLGADIAGLLEATKAAAP